MQSLLLKFLTDVPEARNVFGVCYIEICLNLSLISKAQKKIEKVKFYCLSSL